MKNIKSVTVNMTTKMKKKLPLVATIAVLVMPFLSAQAQLSIYGGNENTTSYDNTSYPNYTQSTPSYSTTNSQVTSYQKNSSNNTNQNKPYNAYNYYNSYNNYNNAYIPASNSSYSTYNNSYNNAYDKAYTPPANSYNNSYNNGYNNQSNDLDKLGGLIEKKASEYQYQTSVLDKARLNAQDEVYDDIYEANSFSNNSYYNTDYRPTFESWQNKYGNRLRVKAYRKYLVKHLGANNVPPMSQLLQTAKSWKKCGAEPYSVPPVYYWHNMLPTLRLFANLKAQGIIPEDTQITSVYRTPSVNRCAGGANGSKHKINSAIDLSSPSMKFNSFKRRQVQNELCNFWLYQGQYYNFGLGLYSKGSIHIDTSKYRKWGNNHSSTSSPCRSPSFF